MATRPSPHRDARSALADGPAECFDVIVVGAGVAGCVIASRLSEDPQLRVLLVEAGEDAPPGGEHGDVRDPSGSSLYNPRFSWPGLSAQKGPVSQTGDRPGTQPFLQGRGVGGGSNINGMIVLRGQPQDFDDWAADGLTGWAWQDVLPYYRKIEHDLDFSGPFNGDRGPLPVRRVKSEDWAPFAMAISRAARGRGFRQIEDSNADYGDGIARLPMANLPEGRVSVASAYLPAAVRQRPNLTIRAGSKVERICCEGARATGIVLNDGLRQVRIDGRQIVLCCGGLFTPVLMMRSGIGPADHLKANGIAVVADVRGVGRNLQNHPNLSLVTFLRKGAEQSPAERSIVQNWLRFTSNRPDCHAQDMGIVFLNRTAWHPLGAQIASAGLCLCKPYSRGSVSLSGSEGTAQPVVRFVTLEDQRDRDRMVGGLRLLLDLLTDPEVSALRNEAFIPNGRIVGALGRRSAWNRVRTTAAAWMMRPRALRRALLGNSMIDLAAIASDDARLHEFVQRYTSVAHHPSGTCRMGRADDPEAVTDHAGRVRAIAGLRIADPSIFPTIPSGGMYFPALMAAEKLSDEIRRDIQGR